MNWRRSLFLLELLFICSCHNIVNDRGKSETKSDSTTAQTDSSIQTGLNFFPLPDDEYISITNKRPDKKDSSITLCIAAAFTQLDNDAIDGFYMIDGNVIRKSVNHHLGGALITAKNGIQIIGTNDGKLMTQNWIDSVSALHRSVLQQLQLIRNGSALDFHNSKERFQCRAIVIFGDGETMMIESADALTLDEFAEKLLRQNVQDAIYCDMGDWDEGWYRNEKGEIITLGTSLLSTNRQSNWLIFKH